MQVTQSSSEKDANTVYNSINQGDAKHMVKDVMHEVRSTILKWYAEGPRPAQSMPLRKKIFMSKNLSLKW